jgi:hypothetical protein
MNRYEKMLAILSEIRRLLEELEYEIESMGNMDVYPSDLIVEIKDKNDY